MRPRILLSLLALTFVTAACGDGDPSLTGDGVVLRYAYAPGDELAYQVDQQMGMTMEASGGDAFAGALDSNMEMDLVMWVDYSVAEGPDPETVEVIIATEIVDGSGSVETLGQTQVIPFRELAAQGTTEVSVVLDAQGNPISVNVGGESLPTDLLGDLQGATGLGELAAPQHLGPQFPDFPIEVGSKWETSNSATTFGIDISTRSEHEVVTVENVAGRSTYRIESVISTDGFSMGLDDVMQAVVESGGDLGEGADLAEIEAAMSMLEAMGIDAEYRINDMTLDMTSWFDAEEGIIVRVEMAMPMTMEVEMTGMPDVGDLAVAMDIEINQVMQLTE